MVPHREKGELLPSEVALNWELRHWVLELTEPVVVFVTGWAVTKVSKVNYGGKGEFEEGCLGLPLVDRYLSWFYKCQSHRGRCPCFGCRQLHALFCTFFPVIFVMVLNLKFSKDIYIFFLYY